MADTHELDPDGHWAADPDDVWGLRERTAEDAPELSQVEQRRRRAQAALALKTRGADLGEIATVLEYATPGEAMRAITELLAQISEGDGPEAWKTQRQLARLRYEGLLAAVYPIAIDATDEGFFQAQRQAAVLIDRVAVLDGLNAPTRHVVYSPGADEFEQVMTEVLDRAGLKAATEGDIFAMAELTELIVDADEIVEGELDDGEEAEH